MKQGWPYYTARWKNLRAKVLRERPTCEACRASPSAHVDHVQPVRQGGDPWSRGNLQALCERDHNAKSRREQGEAGILGKVTRKPLVTGCDRSGFPLDRRHWWWGAK